MIDHGDRQVEETYWSEGHINIAYNDISVC